MDLEFLHALVQPATTKIVLCSLDGLGGLPRPATGKSELETARIPNLHALARPGRLRPAAPRGPRHHAGQRARPPRPLRLRSPALSGGAGRARGARHRLRAAGGRRRRARELLHGGRAAAASPTGGPGGISTERLRSPGRAAARDPPRRGRGAHRAGEGAPLRPRPPRRAACPAGCPRRIRSSSASRPCPSEALRARGGPDGRARERFVEAARPLLRDAAPANMLLLRGFDQQPRLPRFPETFGLRAAAIAAYPMYRGLARLVGMEVLKTGGTFAERDRHARASSGTTTTSSSCTTRTPTRRARTATSTRRSPRWSASTPLLPRVLALQPDVLAISGRSRDPVHPQGPRLAGGARAPGESLLRGRPGEPLHRAGLRGRLPRGDARPGPDAARDGQRAPIHQVRGVAGHSRYPDGETMRRSYCLLSAAVLLALGVIGLAVPTREPAPPAVTEAPAVRAGPGAARARGDRAEAGRDARDRPAPDRRGARRRRGDRGRAARQRQHATPRPRRAAQSSSPAPDGKPAAISYARSPAERYEIRPGGDGRWAVSAVRPDVDTRVVAITGELQDSLFASMERLGETAGLTARLVNLFEWDFDFAADSLPGDRFRLLVEKRYVGDVFLGYGDVLVAQYCERRALAAHQRGLRRRGRPPRVLRRERALGEEDVPAGPARLHARHLRLLARALPPGAGRVSAAPRGRLRGADRHAGARGGRRGGHPGGLERRLRDLHLAAPRPRLRDHVQPPLQDRRPSRRAGAPAPGHRAGRQHRPVHRPASRLPRRARAGSWSTRWARSSSPARPCPPIAARRSRCTSTPSWSGSTRRLRSPRVHRDDS